MFNNKDLLKNIEESDSSFVTVHCNAGVVVTNLVGTLEGYGEVWYNPRGIANILSLTNVSKKCRVTFNSTSKDGPAFIVEQPGSV